MNDRTRGLLLIAITALLWGTLGTSTRFAGNADATTIAFYRSLFGSITFFIVILFSSRVSKIFPKENKKHMILFGIINVLVVFFLAAAIQASTIANALLLFYTAPIFASILAMVFLREKIRRQSIVSLALCMMGIVFIVGNDLATNLWLGTAFGLMAGISYASSITMGRYLKSQSGMISGFWLNAVSLILIFPLSSPFSIQIGQLPPLIWMGVINSGVCVLLLLEGLKRVNTQSAGIVLMIDPITNIILGVLIFLELPSLVTIIGGALVLSAVAFQIISSKKE